MPLGIITKEQLEEELLNLEGNKLPSVKIIEKTNSGRKDGDLNKTESVRKLLGEEVVGGTSPKELKELFKTSDSSLSAYKNGKNSSADIDKDPELNKHVMGTKDKIKNKAFDLTNVAMNELTPEVIRAAKPREIAGIAKEMASIAKLMEPDKEIDNSNKVQIVFFAPPQRNEDVYEIVKGN